jgi:hypothetical protein
LVSRNPVGADWGNAKTGLHIHGLRRRVRMSLQAKLDAFKADFEAGKPPYNDVMRELRATGTGQRAQS